MAARSPQPALAQDWGPSSASASRRHEPAPPPPTIFVKPSSNLRQNASGTRQAQDWPPRVAASLHSTRMRNHARNFAPQLAARRPGGHGHRRPGGLFATSRNPGGSDLRGPPRGGLRPGAPLVEHTLTGKPATLDLGGTTVDTWALGDTAPGSLIRATAGDMAQDSGAQPVAGEHHAALARHRAAQRGRWGPGPDPEPDRDRRLVPLRVHRAPTPGRISTARTSVSSSIAVSTPR